VTDVLPFDPWGREMVKVMDDPSVALASLMVRSRA
jgi:hypothetical protein